MSQCELEDGWLISSNDNRLIRMRSSLMHTRIDGYTQRQTQQSRAITHLADCEPAGPPNCLPPSPHKEGHSRTPSTPLPLLLGMCQLHPFPRHPRASGSVGVCTVISPLFTCRLFVHSLGISVIELCYSPVTLPRSQFLPLPASRWGATHDRVSVRGQAPWRKAEGERKCRPVKRDFLNVGWVPLSAKKWQAVRLMDVKNGLIPSLTFNVSWPGPCGICPQWKAQE